MRESMGGGGVTNLGESKNIWPFWKFRLPTDTTFPPFWAWGKNLASCPEKKNDNIGWYFYSSFAIFLEFLWEFDNNSQYFRPSFEIFACLFWFNFCYTKRSPPKRSIVLKTMANKKQYCLPPLNFFLAESQFSVSRLQKFKCTGVGKFNLHISEVGPSIHWCITLCPASGCLLSHSTFHLSSRTRWLLQKQTFW